MRQEHPWQDEPDPIGADRRTLLKTAAGLTLMGAIAMPANAHPTEVPKRSRGIPGARNVDHAGIVVRDLDEAVRFFVEVVGADLLFLAPPAAGLEKKEEAEPGTTVAVAFLRFGSNLNLELLQFAGPTAPASPPWVSKTVRFTSRSGWRMSRKLRTTYAHSRASRSSAISASPRPAPTGAQRVYARTPFGVHLELVNRPAHMPYERDTPAWR